MPKILTEPFPPILVLPDVAFFAKMGQMAHPTSRAVGFMSCMCGWRGSRYPLFWRLSFPRDSMHGEVWFVIY